MLILGIVLVTYNTLNAQELATYIEEAQTNNPEIRVFALRHTIADEQINETQSLPNTELSAGYFVSEPETRTGAQKARFSIRQMLPWFGSITARKNYATTMAEAEYIDIAIAKRKLSLSVATTYYRLYAIKAKQRVIASNINVLKTYEKLALTSVTVGKASTVDVLRLQIRQNELVQQHNILEQEYHAAQHAFNTLLNRDENIPVVVVDSLSIPETDPVSETDNLQPHPELVKYDKLYASVEELEILNQKESTPGIGIGLDYVVVAERPDMNFSDNGKDIFMPMIAVSLPVFNRKYRSRTQQHNLKKQELIAAKAQRNNTLNTLLAKARTGQTAAKIRYDTQSVNLERAEDARNILMKSYETGTINVNDVLDVQELQLKFQIHQIEAAQNYYEQTALINYLIR
ncbi:MAG: TolC family protein [Bacteroidota bacterium]